ncbi:MAG: glycosyl hydrolase [Segetibacter sp.]
MHALLYRSPDSACFPGKQYVDIAGADTYNIDDNPQTAMYKKIECIRK